MKLSGVIKVYKLNNFVEPMFYTVSFTFYVMDLQNLKISYICHLCVFLKQWGVLRKFYHSPKPKNCHMASLGDPFQHIWSELKNGVTLIITC